MITDKTLDEALVELLRCKKALEALRKARKKITREQMAQMYVAPPSDGTYTEEDVRAVLSAPFISPYRRLAPQHAAAKRASLDLTRKLADLRAGR